MIDNDEYGVSDQGFTLVELLIVIGTLGLVSVVIASTFTVIVRTTPSAEARNDDSRTLLGLTNYLPFDVSSTPVSAIAVPGGPTVCGVSDGVSLLSLEWTDFASSVKTQINYRLVDQGGWRVIRYGCTSGVSSKVNLTSTLAVGSSVPSPFPVSVLPLLGDHDKDSNVVTPDQQVGVIVNVTTMTGLTQRLDAISDNVPASLPPVVITTSTSSTIVAPTNVAPVPIDKSLQAWPSQSVVVNLVATDGNGDPITASIDPARPLPGALWSASFTGLQMTLTPDPSAAPGPYTFGFLATDPFGAAGNATVMVDIVATGSSTTTSTTSTTSTTTTTIPCAVSSVSLNRTSISNGVHEDVAKLKQPFTVTIVKSGSCGSVVLAFTPDANPPATPAPPVPFNGGTQVTVGKDDFAWSDGNHTLQVRNGVAGPVLQSITLEVT